MDVSAALQIKATLEGSRPPIWRRLVVAGDATLLHLHYSLQVAMGWENAHLHCFRIGDVRYGPADDEAFDLAEVDESTVSVSEAFASVEKGSYEYDFGDSWDHRLVVEKRGLSIEGSGMATCTGGKRACPPEDCGGIWGYEHMLEVLADPKHEEHEDVLEWLGEGFDPETFDPAVVNLRLERLSRPRRSVT